MVIVGSAGKRGRISGWPLLAASRMVSAQKSSVSGAKSGGPRVSRATREKRSANFCNKSPSTVE